MGEEEKKAADQIDNEIEKNKTSKELADVKNQLAGLEDLLKSTMKQISKSDEEEETEELFDFESVSPEELAENLAKSFKSDEERTEYLVKFAEACGVMPQDMYDKEGEPYIDENMLKSINESEDKGNRLLSGIFYSMQEANDRRTKMDATILQTMSVLAKSISDIGKKIENMNKSVSEGDIEGDTGEENKEDGQLPDLGEHAASPPLSEQESSNNGQQYNLTQLKKAIERSFPGNYGNTEEQAKCHKYICEAEKIPDDIMGFVETIPNKSDRDLIKSNLQVW
ncbi:MAG: hypothetical protein JSU85_05140 [Candidatus Zixiibacteriota bacterium]|nr:MAG: hypothetical protein JSU85_05140 [candidate division Zixibacteria bacterium]